MKFEGLLPGQKAEAELAQRKDLSAGQGRRDPSAKVYHTLPREGKRQIASKKHKKARKRNGRTQLIMRETRKRDSPARKTGENGLQRGQLDAHAGQQGKPSPDRW